jgi:hypothetical protein
MLDIAVFTGKLRAGNDARHNLNEGNPATQTFQLTKEQRWQQRSWKSQM